MNRRRGQIQARTKLRQRAARGPQASELRNERTIDKAPRQDYGETGMTEDRDDIRDTMEADRQQTPTRKYKVAGALRARVLAGFRKALQECDWGAFEGAILELGLQPGSPEYERALKEWYRLCGKSGR